MRRTIAAVRELLAGRPMPTESGSSADGNSTVPSPGDDAAARPSGHASAAYLRFRPRRVTPIYLGAMGPAMLRLAGAVADGALPLLFPPEHYFTVRPLIEEGFPSRTAPPSDFDLAACVWVSVADDPAAARRALAEKVAYYGHALSPLILDALGLDRSAFAPIERAVMIDRDMDRACQLVTEPMLRIGVYGKPEMIVERLAPLVGAGVSHLSFGPPLGPDPVRAVELLGREVLPRFNG
jgi:5,10-methylenetetrahydromethanopterin reductase